MIFQLAEPQPPQPPEPPDVEVGEESDAALVALLPWVISFLLHVGIVVLALFALWSTVRQTDEEEIIIPMVELSETPGAPLQMTTEQQVREQAETQTREIVEQQTQSESSQSALEATADESSELVGLSGGASGSSSNPFDTSVASGAEFRVQFMGNRGGNARKIAFVIDATGSLIDTLPFVVNELKKTINNLSERQQFTVIFYNDDPVLEVPTPNRGFKRATGENKQNVIDWIDQNVIPRGSTTPIPAIEQALRYQPDLIFMLSDEIEGSGRYEVDRRRLLEEIAQANTAGTKICTIQFLYRSDLSTRLGIPEVMELIADQSGGTYKFVDSQETGRTIHRLP
ncbi:MAG: vWA domain-containing protein [Phycisphaeraceae bacterium]